MFLICSLYMGHAMANASRLQSNVSVECERDVRQHIHMLLGVTIYTHPDSHCSETYRRAWYLRCKAANSSGFLGWLMSHWAQVVHFFLRFHEPEDQCVGFLTLYFSSWRNSITRRATETALCVPDLHTNISDSTLVSPSWRSFRRTAFFT